MVLPEVPADPLLPIEAGAARLESLESPAASLGAAVPGLEGWGRGPWVRVERDEQGRC